MNTQNKLKTWKTLLFTPVLLVFILALPAGAGVIDDILTKVEAIQTKVGNIQTNVTNIKQESTEAVTAIRGGLSSLGADMREEILGALEEAKDGIAEVKADRAAFTANSAQFKSDLGGMLLGMENLAAAIAQFTNLPVPMDFSRERALIDILPDRAFGPLYRALAGPSGVDFGGLALQLEEAASNIQFLALAIQETAPGPAVTTLSAPAAAAAPDVVPALCDNMLADPAGVRQKTLILASLGGSLKLIGKGLIAAGQSGVSGKPVQIHGYVGVQIVNNRPKKIGNLLDGVSEIILVISSYSTNKLRYCTILDSTQTTLNAISALETSVAAHASQASVDALQLSLNQNLDTTVSSRASQVSVDGLQDTALRTLAGVDSVNADIPGIQGQLGAIQDTLGIGKIDLDIVEVSGLAADSRRWLVFPTINGRNVETVLSELRAISADNSEDVLLEAVVVPMETGMFEVSLPLSPGGDGARAYLFKVDDRASEATGSKLVGTEGASTPTAGPRN